MSRLCLYYRKEPWTDRWVPGDRFIRPFIRRMVRGKERVGGVERVFLNLCAGLDKAGIKYEKNLPFKNLRPDDRVGVLGRGRASLQGYDRENPIVAGIGLMTHPSEWPDLCEKYPIKVYLQHSEWAADIYRPYYGDDKVGLWPVGIPTDDWLPQPEIEKEIDVLIYDKVHWRRDDPKPDEPRIWHVEEMLRERGLKFHTLTYGFYEPEDYKWALARAKSMIVLAEHESQGLAYQEAMSCGVPIIAWENGYCLDPNYEVWEKEPVKASSVPFFDERCGQTFQNLAAMAGTFDEFWEGVQSGRFAPRDYVLENLTLDGCARDFLKFFDP